MTSQIHSYWNPKPKNKCIGELTNVTLICDDEYMNLCDKLSKDRSKYSIFWNLLKAYKLNDDSKYGNKLKIIPSSIASKDDLLLYHDENYISLLERVENYPSFSYQNEEEKELLAEYGLIDDNPIFDDLYDYCLNITGSSLKCAELIKNNETRIAINYGGGRHHSFSSKANGFCYVNDIILCIDSLRDKFNKILYIDIDLHHCDSIQEAYYNSNNVFVFSIHHKDIDFFPQNTGQKNKFGEKQGMFYNLNVPIHKNLKLNDDIFLNILSKVIHRLNYYFQPQVIVICTGCDGLKSDPFKKWNLTINGITKAINMIITQMDKPTIILGGGGYNPYDTAKCWLSIISSISNININNDIPFHSNYSLFKPYYQLNKLSSNSSHSDITSLKLNINAIQMIYAHLNNFERMFVQKVIKSKNNKHKNGQKRQIKTNQCCLKTKRQKIQ